jgi:hypothetical protein
MVALMGCYRCGGKGRSNRWRGRSVMERIVVKHVVTVVVAEGTAEKERERETAEKREKQERVAGFLSTLNSIFFILRP